MNIPLLIILNIILLIFLILSIFLNNSIIFLVLFGIVFSLIFISCVVYFFYLVYGLIKDNKNFIPFVPTSMKVVNAMIDFASVKEGDLVYDLGCGDGRIVAEVSKIKNVKAIGVEKKIDVYLTALVFKFFNKTKYTIKLGDIFDENLSNANVIFLYLMPNIMGSLEKKIIDECNNGTIIISNSFLFQNLVPVDSMKIDNKDLKKYIIKK